MVPLLKLNNRKKGTLIIMGSLRNLVSFCVRNSEMTTWRVGILAHTAVQHASGVLQSMVVASAKKASPKPEALYEVPELIPLTLSLSVVVCIYIYIYIYIYVVYIQYINI